MTMPCNFRKQKRYLLLIKYRIVNYCNYICKNVLCFFQTFYGRDKHGSTTATNKTQNKTFYLPCSTTA